MEEYISVEEFEKLPPPEQDRLMREYIMELSPEERAIFKRMIENERNDKAAR